MYRAIRSYLRARTRLLNAEAEKLSPSPLVMLTQTALPFLAGALHGYFQPTSASGGKTSAAGDSVEYPRSAYSVHVAKGTEPELCPICKGTMVPGDVHRHPAEAAEMWAKAPDWIHAERVATEKTSEPFAASEKMTVALLRSASALLRRAREDMDGKPNTDMLHAEICAFLSVIDGAS